MTVVDLESDANQMVMHWIREQTQECQDVFTARWAPNARELYNCYQSWAINAYWRVVSPQEFLDLMKAVYPKLQLVPVGVQGEMRFLGVRRLYPLTAAEKARLQTSEGREVRHGGAG